ncbi:MAG TPA: hypothetical protein VM406_05885, partial [Noviherbaspirillum sp.]|nr:hypothetical protein [Noviherbaspirillum sp.]
MRVVLVALGVLLAVVLALAALAAWLLGTEAGARALLPRVLDRADAGVTVSGIHGRLLGPLRIDRIVVDRPNERIELADVRLAWRPRALLERRLLHIESLHAAHLLVLGRVEREPEPDTEAPEDLRLPLEVRVDDLRLDGGELRRGPAPLATLGPLALALTYEDEQYRLDLRRFGAAPQFEAGTAQAGVQGRLDLSARHPFPLTGRFQLTSKATVEERAVGASGRLMLNGTLIAMQAALDARINDAPVSGSALLRPFDEQPLGKTEL